MNSYLIGQQQAQLYKHDTLNHHVFLSLKKYTPYIKRIVFVLVSIIMRSSNTCHNTSNNKHPRCPPRMSDGRHFTDHRPQCYVNNLVQQNNEITNSYQMRMFLTHNANKLMQVNRQRACDRNCCGPCQKPYQVGTMGREAQADVVGAPVPCGEKSSQPSVVEAHSGQPLACPAWNSGNSRATETNCCSPVANLASTYPVDPSSVVVSRKSVQGGGMPMVTAVQ